MGKLIFKNGFVVNVFTDEIYKADVCVQDDKILGVGSYAPGPEDQQIDVEGKFLCPGLIDGHIHIESTMLTPTELARVCLPHGTTTIVADPHEIANVCGEKGIRYMLETSRDLPMQVYMMLPSCVPATGFDESGAVLGRKELLPFYDEPRVLGLGEMMNYPGVLAGDEEVIGKIRDALERGKKVDGHAPLLSGRELDRYIAAGIQTDHECSSFEEARERIKKGQWVMIRQGTAARNLEGLLPLFDPAYNRRCLLVTDDRHPADLLTQGHIDNIIRLAVQAGKPVTTAIRMATIQAAQCFGLSGLGAIAPGYRADILVLSDLEQFRVEDVYCGGCQVVDGGVPTKLDKPEIREELHQAVTCSFRLEPLKPEDFYIEPKSRDCRVICLVKDQLLTRQWNAPIYWDKDNGVDLQRDIIKLAVVERHHNTGHKGVGFLQGVGLKRGAIAASVSHDSHNLIVIGTNQEDMAVAANRVRQMGGGSVVVDGGHVLAKMPLPIAGLMSPLSAPELARQNSILRQAVYSLGVPEDIEPFMSMAFVSLPVIPDIKMTPQGLVDVNRQERLSLWV